MLSPEDKELASRDSALPALGVLLDATEFGAALQRLLPSQRIGAFLPTYLRYKPGTSCLAGFRGEVEGVAIDVHAVTSVTPSKVRIRSRDAVEGGPLGRYGRALPGLPVVVRAFPNDASLKALPRIADPAQRRRILPSDLAESTWTTLRYKPERRWVARFDSAAGSAVIKVHGPHAVGPAIRGANTFHSTPDVAVAPLLHSDPAQGVVVLGWLAGAVLADLAAGGWDPAGATSIGRALAALHAQRAGSADGTPAPPSERLADLGATLGVLLPHRAGMLRTHAATLIGALHELALPSTWIHGDFYAKQVLINDSTVGVLDLDEARPGDPAEDLGNFRAHLFRDILRGRISTEYADRLWTALLDGYGVDRDDWHLRLQLYTSIGCFRLASDPFRHREPDWSRGASQLIDLSVAALAPLLATANRG